MGEISESLMYIKLIYLIKYFENIDMFKLFSSLLFTSQKLLLKEMF